MKSKFSKLLLVVVLIMSPNIFYAQVGNSLIKNAANVKSSQVSDAQLKVIMERALESGMTPEQLEVQARRMGMSEKEIEKLVQRAERLYEKQLDESETGSRKIKNIQNVEYPKSLDERLAIEKKADLTDNPNFGFGIFRNPDLTFEPSFNVSTPENYIIGPGDILNIDVWGASQQSYQEVVSNEGNIIITKVGPIDLNGLSIEDANRKVKSVFSNTIYERIKENKTFVKVSLGSVRSIKVNILGDVTLPGTYNLSSLATVFNAMYVAGGPSKNGSIRDVKVIRGKKIIAELDFYEYLLSGVQTNNLRLQDQDIVFVSPYSNRVEIKGKVKRNMFFDMKTSETLKDLISYAGGFTGEAYRDRIKIYRKTGKEKKILDFTTTQFGLIKLVDGDQIIVDSVLNRFENRVTISGAVMRPGYYAIDSVSTLKQLIAKSDGFREDVFKDRISILRLKEDLSRENIAVDLNKLYAGNLDFPLQREDSIYIPSIYDLREEYYLTIKGEIRLPGVYSFADNTKVEDLILRAGGLLESASMAHVEVARRVKDPAATNSISKLGKVYKFTIDKNLKLGNDASDFVLKPYDQVFIRKSPAFAPQHNVTITGEINFPGEYSIISKTERISDLIKRAGNITPEAYLKGASLIRKKNKDKEISDKAIETIASETDKKNTILVSKSRYDIIGIDLEEIIKNPGSPSDLFLQEGDSIRIIRHSQTIKVSGAVYNPNVIPYYKNFKLRDYITHAGGFTKNAKRGHIYIVHANGSVKKTRRSSNQKIEAGAEIVVPSKNQQRRMSAAETISLSSAMASLALLIVTIIKTI